MSKQRFKLGDQVLIKKCEHSDIKPKTFGKIVTKEFERGFGVEINGSALTIFVEKKHLVNIER